jgi:hypothetical protein
MKGQGEMEFGNEETVKAEALNYIYIILGRVQFKITLKEGLGDREKNWK